MKSFLLALSFYALKTSSAFAQSTGQINIVPDIANSAGTGGPGNVTGWVQSFYQFSLIAGVFLAVGVIVWAGLRYTLAAGNPSTQSDARDQILQALLGLILLFGAYLILYTINPNLVNLSLPTLDNVSVTAPAGGGTGGVTGTTGENCASGKCQALPNCTVSASTNCGGSQGMVDLLNCVNQADSNYAVNEGYPPKVTHSTAGHNNGCSIDVHVSNCQQVTQFMSAAKSCGSSDVLNEYTDCGGTTYANTTGGNVHVSAPKGSGGC